MTEIQIPKQCRPGRFWSLSIWIWDLFVIWCLEFVFFDIIRQGGAVLPIICPRDQVFQDKIKHFASIILREYDLSPGKHQRYHTQGFRSAPIFKEHDCRSAWRRIENQAYGAARRWRGQQDVHSVSIETARRTQVLHWDHIRTQQQDQATPFEAQQW